MLAHSVASTQALICHKPCHMLYISHAPKNPQKSNMAKVVFIKWRGLAPATSQQGPGCAMQC